MSVNIVLVSDRFENTGIGPLLEMFGIILENVNNHSDVSFYVKNQASDHSQRFHP